MTKASCESWGQLNLPTKPLFLVISGPSGAGKDTVLTRMKQLFHPIHYIVTVTTRPQRSNERDNVNYHFVSQERFKKMISNGELLEWANVYGNWYGVPKQSVKEALDSGQDAIVKVDIQGVTTIKKLLPQAVFIFIVPPSMTELASRLKQRNTESSADLALRLETAKEEAKKFPLFDYVVISRQDGVDQVISDIKAIISAEKCRVIPRDIRL